MHFNIFGFCETLGQNVNQFDTFMSGLKTFSAARKERFKKGRPSGSVTVFVKNDLM